MYNLEKRYRWSYLQSWNRDTDIEIKCMDTKRGGEGELGNWNWHIYTTDPTYKIEKEWKLTIQHRGFYSMLYGYPHGNKIQKKGHTGVCVPDSLCWKAETTNHWKATILQIKKIRNGFREGSPSRWSATNYEKCRLELFTSIWISRGWLGGLNKITNGKVLWKHI